MIIEKTIKIGGSMDAFDDKAKTWDDDPVKVERAQILAKKISLFIDGKAPQKGFEFGCGTGLLSFYLKDFFKEIILADTSKGMLKVLKEKMEINGIKHFKPLLLSEENPHHIDGIDFIYSSMTLHHVHDLDEVFERFYQMLRSKGYLCIADLEEEEGDFHGQADSQNVHHFGFERQRLVHQLEENGFACIHYEIFYEINKKIENGSFKKFPLFLLIAQKI
ncbi:MAG TPA: hypothetical protein DCQ26_11640 [Marinilabiliales bacterium]|jgi:SAM-dependent methyltransferase|nr:hypothetical protein [Marinilabiliales bacterium]HAZ00936.1 hypothetical protein [Marinilabiliales bacterium]HBO76457.1 hypothetical protein [Marinilabiliales bacterium]HBX83991.1 hypothetical protein [Marinilabiliales bacterium]HBY53635.1 hypothetical protein [Marinilabiliales bacterium]